MNLSKVVGNFSFRLFVGHCPFGNKFLIIQKKKKEFCKGTKNYQCPD